MNWSCVLGSNFPKRNIWETQAEAVRFFWPSFGSLKIPCCHILSVKQVAKASSGSTARELDSSSSYKNSKVTLQKGMWDALWKTYSAIAPWGDMPGFEVLHWGFYPEDYTEDYFIGVLIRQNWMIIETYLTMMWYYHNVIQIFTNLSTSLCYWHSFLIFPGLHPLLVSNSHFSFPSLTS